MLQCCGSLQCGGVRAAVTLAMQDELARWVKVWHYTIYGMATMQVGRRWAQWGATSACHRHAALASPAAGSLPAGWGPCVALTPAPLRPLPCSLSS